MQTPQASTPPIADERIPPKRSETARPSGTSYVVGLDLLRFICAAAVAFFHLGFASWSPGRPFPAGINGAEPPAILAAVSSFGWIGVQVFFVISGFVIAETTKAGGSGRFIWARITRLYPAAIACATLTFLALLVSTPESSPDLAKLWLKTMTLFPIGPSIDPVYWTLAVEMVFYAFVFAALWLCGPRAVFPVVALIGLFSAFSHISPAFFEALNMRDAAEMFRGMAAGGTLGLFTLAQEGAHFAVGAALWALRERGVSILRLAVLLIAIAGGVAQVLTDDLRREGYGYYPVDQTAGVVALYFGAVAILALSAWNNEALSRGLDPNVIAVVRFLGMLTYPLYLLHNYIGVAIIRPLLTSGAAPMFAITAALVLTLSLSILVRLYAERPLQIWLKRRGRGLQKLVDASSPFTRRTIVRCASGA